MISKVSKNVLDPERMPPVLSPKEMEIWMCGIVSEATIRRMLRDGEIKGHHIGRKWAIAREEAKKFMGAV